MRYIYLNTLLVIPCNPIVVAGKQEYTGIFFPFLKNLNYLRTLTDFDN
jgi:hypothetical protein